MYVVIYQLYCFEIALRKETTPRGDALKNFSATYVNDMRVGRLGALTQSCCQLSSSPLSYIEFRVSRVIMTQHFTNPIPTDSSSQRMDRIHRTNTSPEVIAAYKKLSLETHIDLNHKIDKRNQRRLLKKATSSSSAEIVSDVESEVDIELYEWDIIRTNPTVYNRVKDKLKSHTLAWIDERNREDSKQPRAREDYTEPTPKRMRFMEDILLEEVDITQRVLVTILEDLCQLAMSDATNSPTSMIKDLLGKAGPYRNQDLSFNGWIEATQNMFNLISSCFQSGKKSPEAIYFKQHTSFFENQTNSADLTGLWLEHEIELREEHHIKPSAYNPLKYSSIWTRVKAKWDTIRQQAKLLDLDPHIPIPELIRHFNAGILSYPSFFLTFHNPSSKLPPFSQNSWENDDSEEELVNLRSLIQ
ncbi:hypothetical protein FB446DRAFT_704707 [Lentinula raphanica]|nr:hypothetical protein FB446DRAFT_704707 [Lentinula raphanica]